MGQCKKNQPVVNRWRGRRDRAPIFIWRAFYAWGAHAPSRPASGISRNQARAHDITNTAEGTNPSLLTLSPQAEREGFKDARWLCHDAPIKRVTHRFPSTTCVLSPTLRVKPNHRKETKSMWTCPKCGEKIEEQFESCWRCQAPRPGVQGETGVTPPTQPTGSPPAPVKWQAKYEIFRGTLATWEELFGQAAQFASEIGPERLITISHSEDRREGVVAVWYWESENRENSEPSATGLTGTEFAIP